MGKTDPERRLQIKVDNESRAGMVQKPGGATIWFDGGVAVPVENEPRGAAGRRRVAHDQRFAARLGL